MEAISLLMMAATMTFLFIYTEPALADFLTDFLGHVREAERLAADPYVFS